MPATDSDPTTMEDPHAVEDEKGSSADVSPSAPPATISASAPAFPTTMSNFTGETVIENRAVSMASNDCSSALSSPAEASPAKPAVTSPTTFEGTVETSPATSHIASASDSLKHSTGTSLVNISESLPSELPLTTFGSSDTERDFSTTLTFQGVSVTLENNSVWKQFHSCGTEMILTKQGRRMFPYCRYRLAGLDPERQYSLALSIVPSDRHKYRWNKSKWEVTGPAEHHPEGLIRAFSHHYSPCKGSEWMAGLVSFYKLKLTNNNQDQDGHIILHSMHCYIPRLHVIPVPDRVTTTPDQLVIMGSEIMNFTFPQTEFMAVTTYQNFRITQLKINHNPFAKGFREDGHNSRLHRVPTEAPVMVKIDTQASVLEENDSKDGVIDLSMKNNSVLASNVQATRLVLKPIMSPPANKDELYVPCIRGKHALGKLVLVEKRPLVEHKEENHNVSVTPKLQRISMTPPPSTSTPGSSPRGRKKRKRFNRRWANSRGREWKLAATSTASSASPAVVHSPSLTVALQPELDDVEGMLFVSFTSKEALEVHVRNKPASSSAAVSPVSPMTQKQLKETVEVIPETDEEKIARLEIVLLQDLKVLKHRQVIHPVLQEVGMKLSSLDPMKSVDLQYLGVHLPLPPKNLPERGNATAVYDKGLPFISRTGKTSDVTKIKGWKNKFIKSNETSPSNCDGLQKNLSAFCSDMLDEYLENEAQQISERAAAFSTNPEGSVAYQLPAKSASYVKTLDSVLKNRSSASRFPTGANRPCPLSHKPLLYSALTSPAPPLVRTEARSIQKSPSSHSHPTASHTVGENTALESSVMNTVSERASTNHPVFNPRPASSSGQNQLITHRPSGLTKAEYQLLKMEVGALNQGLSRTQLTADRLSVALSVILTKEMAPSQILKSSQHPKYKPGGPECGQEFCVLGCVCSSLQHLNRGPLHCRRPECMFGCACFKRKITKQISSGESEQQIQPVYSMTNMEHTVPPNPGSHSKKLWDRNIHDPDPEPLLIPNSSPSWVTTKFFRRHFQTRPMLPMREEDKDPVYKYLESMMTCARVREFNSKPPPEVTIEPKILDTSPAKTETQPQKTTTDQPAKHYKTIKTLEKPENNCQDTTTSETGAKTQIQIQSACQWDKDHKMVVDVLCRRMNKNRLSQKFHIGPYRISPLSKVIMRKPSGTTITYRVHISKPSKDSENEEDEYDDSDEEKPVNKTSDVDFGVDEEQEVKEENGQTEESGMQIGVTPFLSGVLPAGKLRARTKPVGYQVQGLIQVNGKSYNQARLLLGSLGSLHPANRLAAYVVGRLHAPADAPQKVSNKSHLAQNNTPDSLRLKAANTLIPQIIAARKTADLKAQFQSDSWRKGSITMPPASQSSSMRSLVSPFQTSSTSSPVSLTVSPSLKTPSFLGQSGTYSFRICPPSNQSTRGHNPPGVTLPGGFTLIQLPKPGADGATQQSETVNKTNAAATSKNQSQRDSLINSGHLAADLDANWLGLDCLHGNKDLMSKTMETGSSPEQICEEKMPSDESDKANNNKQLESNMDDSSEGSSCESTDSDDEDEDLVDVEAVEEVWQTITITKLREAAFKASQKSRDSFEDFGSVRECNIRNESDNEHLNSEIWAKKKRKNHSVIERQRRLNHRDLFDKLQNLFQNQDGTTRAPRAYILSQALKEIHNLVQTSKTLEQKKKKLIEKQSVYMKALATLSGKSEVLIKHKLVDICKRQKMREKMVFSHLLQSRAAYLQSQSKSQSDEQRPPLLQPDFMSSSETDTTALNSVHQLIPLLLPKTPRVQSGENKPLTHPTAISLPQAVSSPAQAEVTAALSQGGNQPSEPVALLQVGQSKFEVRQEAPGAPGKGSTPNSQSQVPSVMATPQVTAAQDEASPVFSTCSPQNASDQASKPFALPLIRSKTGRIILPSSLKPIGQGFYTLMVMTPKEEVDKGEASTSADVVSTNQEKSFSASDQPSDSKSSHIENETTSSNSDPTCTRLKSPLDNLALLNKSIYVPSVAVKAVGDNLEGFTVEGLNQIQAAACLSFKHVPQIPTSDPNSPAGQRRRGRPRKNQAFLLSEEEKSIVVEKTRKREYEQCEKVTEVEENTAVDHDEAENDVAVKRSRGRPPRRRFSSLSLIARKRCSSSKSNKDSPDRQSSPLKSPDAKPKPSSAASTSLGNTNTSRPLTRGALGKDFPSAKKRSWIDIKKELEPELESE